MAFTSNPWLSWKFLFFYLYTIFFYWKVISRAVLLSNQYATAAFSPASASVFSHPGAFRGLARGWLGNRLVDVNDSQWRSFRENLPLLAALMACLAAGAWLVRCSTALLQKQQGQGSSQVGTGRYTWQPWAWLMRPSASGRLPGPRRFGTIAVNTPFQSGSVQAAKTQPNHLRVSAGSTHRAPFSALAGYWLIVGLLYLAYLHGACLLFLLALVTTNYLLVKALADAAWRPPRCPQCLSRQGMVGGGSHTSAGRGGVVTRETGISRITAAAAILNHLIPNRLIRFQAHSLLCASDRVARTVAAAVPFPALLWLLTCAAYCLVRQYEGFRFAALSIPSLGVDLAFLDGHRGAFRWQVCFNLVLLRMISFGMDCHWAALEQAAQGTAGSVAVGSAGSGYRGSGYHSGTTAWSAATSGGPAPHHITAPGGGGGGNRNGALQKEASPSWRGLPADDADSADADEALPLLAEAAEPAAPPPPVAALPPRLQAVVLRLQATRAAHAAKCLTCRGQEQGWLWGSLPCYTALQDTPLLPSAYSFPLYLAYLFFPPLYLSGPIVSFNAFVAQLSPACQAPAQPLLLPLPKAGEEGPQVPLAGQSGEAGPQLLLSSPRLPLSAAGRQAEEEHQEPRVPASLLPPHQHPPSPLQHLRQPLLQAGAPLKGEAGASLKLGAQAQVREAAPGSAAASSAPQQRGEKEEGEQALLVEALLAGAASVGGGLHQEEGGLSGSSGSSGGSGGGGSSGGSTSHSASNGIGYGSSSCGSQGHTPSPCNLAEAPPSSAAPSCIHWRYVLQYGARLALAFLLMEVISHWCYFSCLAATASRWAPLAAASAPSPPEGATSAESGYRPPQPPVSSADTVALDAAVVSYGIVNVTWLKFFLIWRFFRFSALLAGVVSPENLPRCINTNYDIEGFWRSWHASYNKWIVRYLYVPLGGSRRKLFNAWLVFTFVALWHDFELRLLLWAWLTALFFAPELLAKACLALPRVQRLRSSWWFLDACALLGALNIFTLMAANLVGFVLGVQGTQAVLRRLLADPLLLLAALFSLYIGVQYMFAIEEGRKGAGQRNVAAPTGRHHHVS